MIYVLVGLSMFAVGMAVGIIVCLAAELEEIREHRLER